MWSVASYLDYPLPLLWILNGGIVVIGGVNASPVFVYIGIVLGVVLYLLV